MYLIYAETWKFSDWHWTNIHPQSLIIQFFTFYCNHYFSNFVPSAKFFKKRHKIGTNFVLDGPHNIAHCFWEFEKVCVIGFYFRVHANENKSNLSTHLKNFDFICRDTQRNLIQFVEILENLDFWFFNKKFIRTSRLKIVKNRKKEQP